MVQNLSRLALVAAFALAGAAHAQKAAETTNTPQRAGEASTMTGGAPNAKTTNETTTATTADKAGDKAAKKADKAAKKASKMGASGSTDKGGAAATSNVPDRAGEASTVSGGVPNKKTTN